MLAGPLLQPVDIGHGLEPVDVVDRGHVGRLLHVGHGRAAAALHAGAPFGHRDLVLAERERLGDRHPMRRPRAGIATAAHHEAARRNADQYRAFRAILEAGAVALGTRDGFGLGRLERSRRWPAAAAAAGGAEPPAGSAGCWDGGSGLTRSPKMKAGTPSGGRHVEPFAVDDPARAA